jgi:hypothetical protein
MAGKVLGAIGTSRPTDFSQVGRDVPIAPLGEPPLHATGEFTDNHCVIGRVLHRVVCLLLLGSLVGCQDRVEHQQKLSVVNSVRYWMADIQIDVMEKRIAGAEEFQRGVALTAKGSAHISKVKKNIDEIWINPKFDLWKDPAKGSTNLAVIVRYHTSSPQKPFGLTFEAKFVEGEKLSKDWKRFVKVPHE